MTRCFARNISFLSWPSCVVERVRGTPRICASNEKNKYDMAFSNGETQWCRYVYMFQQRATRLTTRKRMEIRNCFSMVVDMYAQHINNMAAWSIFFYFGTLGPYATCLPVYAPSEIL